MFWRITCLLYTSFLDGINDSLVEPNPIEEMEEDTVVSLSLIHISYLRDKIANVCVQKNILLENLYHKPALDPDKLYEELMEYKAVSYTHLYGGSPSGPRHKIHCCCCWLSLASLLCNALLRHEIPCCRLCIRMLDAVSYTPLPSAAGGAYSAPSPPHPGLPCP